MPSVHDSLRDNRGIRILDTQLDDITGQVGRFDLLYHTNGRVYIIFARTCQINTPEITGEEVDRQIWAAYSEDGGTIFTHLTRLTARNGSWADHPCICQIEPDKIDSDIGVIYGSAIDWMNTSTTDLNYPYPYRFTMNIELVRTSPIDLLTNARREETQAGSLMRGNNRFLYFTFTPAENGSIHLYENQIVETNAGDGFLNNAWQRRTISSIGSINTFLAFQARQLKNGHIIILFAGQTANKGSISQTNLFYSVSADDGYTWTTPIALTNYIAASLDIDLVGFQGVMSADFAELSDGSLALVYQEGKSAQSIPYSSIPWGARNATLLNSKNYLLVPNGATDGGLYVFDLNTAQTIFRITTSTTPPIWSLTCNCVAVSPDEKYMAVGTDLSIDFYDITNHNPANWILIQSLRRSSTPALLGTSVYWARFIDNTHCIFGYGSGTEDYTWGGKVNVTNIAAGITPLKSSDAKNTQSLSSTTTQPHVDLTKGIIYVVSGNHLWVTRLSDGVALRGILLPGSYAHVFYDDVNNEFVLLNLQTGIYRYQDTGTTFIQLGSQLITSEPIMFPKKPYAALCYPGSGLMIHLSALPTWYDFRSRLAIGPLLSLYEDYIGFNHVKYSIYPPSLVRNDEWALYPHERGIAFLPMKHIGRLRWGIFTYNATAKTIDATSSDFYDLVNSDWVPVDDTTHLVTPKVCAAPSDNVVLAAFRYFPGRQGARGLAFVTGVMNLEHQQLNMRAAISKPVKADGLALRARMAIRTTRSLGMRTQIHMAKCVKMRAWIIPEQTQTIHLRAAIVGVKRVSWQGQFDVSRTGKTRRLRLQFTANTGYTGKQGIGAKARIVIITRKRFTGHFIVPANPTNDGTYTFSADMSHKYFVGMKAFLVSSR